MDDYSHRKLDGSMNPASSSIPWKHSWKHSMLDRYGDPRLDIEMTCYEETATELVENFAFYLMGCGFFQSNIIEAFDSYIQVHGKTLIASAERLKANADQSSLSS